MKLFKPNPIIKNIEPLYTFTRSDPDSSIKWVWFSILKNGSTAVRGMINRHLRLEGLDGVSYETTLLDSRAIQFSSDKKKHENLRTSRWTPENPTCETPVAFTQDDPIENYVTFAFSRNPWSRTLSCWCDKRYVNKNQSKEAKGEQTPFKEFVQSYAGKNMYLEPNRHMQMQCGAFVNFEPTFIGRLENAHEDFSHLCGLLNVEKPQEMLHKNKTKHKHYSEYYDDETREIVADIYADDVERFGYEFETL